MAENEEILLGQLAVKRGFISRQELEEALSTQERLRADGKAKPLGQILIELGLLTEKQAAKLLVEQRDRAGAVRRIGHFEVYAKLGEGGMGAVYLAKMTGPPLKGGDARGAPEKAEEGPLVALKILPPKLAKDESFLMRFKREVEVLSRLNHPNIVRAVDWGRADGLHFLAMDFVQGENSYQKVSRDGPMDERDAVTLALEMARALEYAHSKGIVHRDIKPENILIDLSGVTHLTDFGLVSRRGLDDDADTTASGTTVGTPYYISPEQAQGSSDVDIRSDLYSLGATLYHLVTGELPFDGDSAPVIMTKHVVEPVPNPLKVRPRLSPALAAVIQKLMAKSPRDRYQTPGELIEDLQKIWKGEPPLRARVLPAPEKAAAERRRSSAAVRRSRATGTRSRTPVQQPVAVAIVTAAALLTVAVGVFVYFYVGWRPRAPGETQAPMTLAPIPPKLQPVPEQPTGLPVEETPAKRKPHEAAPTLHAGAGSAPTRHAPVSTPPRKGRVVYSVPFHGDTPVRGRFVPDPKEEKDTVCAPAVHYDDRGRRAFQFLAASDLAPVIPSVYPEYPMCITYLAKGTSGKARFILGHVLNGVMYTYPSVFVDMAADWQWHDARFLLRNATVIPDTPIHDLTVFLPIEDADAELLVSAVEVLDAPHGEPLFILDASRIEPPPGWTLERGVLWSRGRGAYLDIDCSLPQPENYLMLGMYIRAEGASAELLVGRTGISAETPQTVTATAGSGGIIRSIPLSSRSGPIRIEPRVAGEGMVGIARLVFYKGF